MKHWILEGHKIKEVDLATWARWFEKADRRVALDKVKGKRSSTVFLGVDHNFQEKGPPLLFETMIFPQNSFQYSFTEEYCERYCERYATWEEAKAGHHRAVDMCRGLVP